MGGRGWDTGRGRIQGEGAFRTRKGGYTRDRVRRGDRQKYREETQEEDKERLESREFEVISRQVFMRVGGVTWKGGLCEDDDRREVRPERGPGAERMDGRGGEGE